jgi:hypothetical protein
MILEIVRFVHVVCALIGMGSGIAVLFGMLIGEFPHRWAAIFLKCALVTSVSGLLLPHHSFLVTDRVSILIIYLSALAVVAWRRYGLAGIWAPVFAMSMDIALCLEILVAVAHVFRYSRFFGALCPTRPGDIFCIAELIAALPFAGFALLIVRRYRTGGSNRLQARAE